MKYRELFEFDPIQAAIRLEDAGRKDHVQRLLASLVVSPELHTSLVRVILPQLALDAPDAGEALILASPHQTGKSHLLSVLSGLAEHGDLAEDFTRSVLKAHEPAGQAQGLAEVEAMAGRFKVLRLELAEESKPLRAVIFARLERYLAGQGVEPADVWNRPTHSPFPIEDVVIHTIRAGRGPRIHGNQ